MQNYQKCRVLEATLRTQQQLNGHNSPQTEREREILVALCRAPQELLRDIFLSLWLKRMREIWLLRHTHEVWDTPKNHPKSNLRALHSPTQCKPTKTSQSKSVFLYTLYLSNPICRPKNDNWLKKFLFHYHSRSGKALKTAKKWQ